MFGYIFNLTLFTLLVYYMVYVCFLSNKLIKKVLQHAFTYNANYSYCEITSHHETLKGDKQNQEYLIHLTNFSRFYD